MADRFDNVEAQRSAEGVAKALRQIGGSLDEALAVADGVLADAETRKRTAQRAAREAETRPTPRTGGQVRVTEEAAAAETRLTRGLRGSSDEVRRATRELEALNRVRQGVLRDFNRAIPGFFRAGQSPALDPIYGQRRQRIQQLGQQLDPALLARRQQLALPEGPRALAGAGVILPDRGRLDEYGRAMHRAALDARDTTRAMDRQASLADAIAQKAGMAPGAIHGGGAGGGGGGGGGGGTTVGPGPEDEDRAARINREWEEMRGRARGLSDEFSYMARQQALAADQMHRHGLLTTEFINAAARGQVTVRELGIQIGGTIAKFAGWTAAAALTYGALTAVQTLGQGALDSLQGVNQLNRVLGSGLDTQRAQRDFRELSREFNLPVGDVVDVYYESAKAFKDQGDAALATRAALNVVKVGELDAAHAANFSTAAVRGFKLEVTDLEGVLNGINQIQNRFGGNFGQIAQGVAQASGSFGSASGRDRLDAARYLSALIATGMQVTGRAGTEIGTIFRRAAETAFRPERRQKLIDLLGIDPADSTIEELINAAFKAVAEHPQDGQLAQTIAKTLSTPDLAARGFTAILQRQDLFIQRLDAARHSAGSMDRELTRALQSPREELSALNNELGRIGAALGQVGAGHGIAAMVRGLQLALRVTEELVNALNLIPEPLRNATFAAAPFLGALALARRFDVGGTLGARDSRTRGILFGGLARNNDRRIRAEVLGGLDAQVGIERRGLEDTSRAAARYRQMADLATIRTNEAVRAGAAEARILALKQQEIALDLRAMELADETAIRRQSLAHMERDTAAFRRDTAITSGGYGRAEEMARNQRLYGTPLDPRPNAETPIVYGPGGAATREFEQGARRMEEATAGAQRDVAAAEGKLARARATGGAALTRAGSAIVGVGALFGPLDAVIFGLIGMYELHSYLTGKQREAQQEIRRLRSLPSAVADPRKIQQQAQRALDEAEGRQGTSNTIDRVGSLVRRLPTVGPVFGAAADYASEAVGTGARGQEEAARRALQQGQYLARAGRGGNARAVGLVGQQIEANFRLQLRRAGSNAEAIQKAVDDAITAVARGRGALFQPGPKTDAFIKSFIQRVRQAGAQLQTAKGNLGDALDAINDAQGLATASGIFGARIDLRGGRLRGGDIGYAQRFKAKAREMARSATSAEEFTSAVQAIGQMDQIVQGALEQRLNLGLALAGDDLSKQRRARQQYLSQMRRLLGRNSDEYRIVEAQIREDQRQARERVIQQRKTDELALMQAQQGLEYARAAAGGASQSTLLHKATQQALEFANAVRKAAGADSVDYLNARKSYYDAVKAVEDYAKQQAQAMAQARIDYALSGTDDPVKQAQIRLQGEQRLAGFAETPAERLAARAKVRGAVRDVRDAQLQARRETIDFNLEMERISIDTAISQYQSLLRMHNLTKQQRRDILLRIKGLQDEAAGASGEFRLDVGSIRLPTTYDVRRAFDPIRAQVRAAQRETSPFYGGSTGWGSQAPNAWAGLGFQPQGMTFNITVNDPNAAGEVYRQIDRALGTNVRARMRNRRAVKK